MKNPKVKRSLKQSSSKLTRKQTDNSQKQNYIQMASKYLKGMLNMNMLHYQGNAS